MKNLKNFVLFENDSEEGSFSFEELSDSAKKNAIESVKQGMWEGEYGADDIAELVIDDDYVFEPIHEEMIKVFGERYDEDLNGNPMIGNAGKDISYISKSDQNYYLHCKNALDVNNKEMFLGFLGIPPYFWDDVHYYFNDSGTYTKIEFEIENEDDLDEYQIKMLNEYIEKAEKIFEDHMSSVLTRITNDIDAQFEDPQIEERIESNDIKFDSEGNPID